MSSEPVNRNVEHLLVKTRVHKFVVSETGTLVLMIYSSRLGKSTWSFDIVWIECSSSANELDVFLIAASSKNPWATRLPVFVSHSGDDGRHA